MSILGTVLRYFSERRARALSLDQAARRLEASGPTVANRMRAASNSPVALEQARHIIGIERWAQARLRQLLGGPALNDEYNGYRPDDVTTLPALADAFAATRAETVALARALHQAGKSGSETIPHNELGALSASGWFIYLDDHALRESLLIR